MKTHPSIRILFVNTEHAFANSLISALRQKDLNVRASTLNNPDKLNQQLKLVRPEIILVCDGGSMSLDKFLSDHTGAETQIPLLIASMENAAFPAKNLSSATSNPSFTIKTAVLYKTAYEVIPIQDVEGLLKSVIHQVALYREKASNRKLARHVLELEKQQQFLLENSSNAIAILNRDTHLYCNKRYAALLASKEQGQLQNTSLIDLVDIAEREKLHKFLGGKLSRKTDLIVKTLPENNSSVLMLSFSPVIFNNEKCLQVSASPAKGNNHYSNEKSMLSGQDILTRLENLENFTTRIETAIAQAISSSVASTLLIAGIENFKEVQETLGKAGTNRVLYEISEFLHSAINAPFAAARLEENEFAVLLIDSDTRQCTRLAEYIQKKFDSVVSGDGISTISINASLGMAVINDLALDAEDMLHRARINRLNGPAGNHDGQGSDLHEQIRHALASNKLALMFQPLVPFQADNLERYEVMMRLDDETGQELLPNDFFHQANLHNLAGELDKQILGQLFADPNLWRSTSGKGDRHLYIHISGNTLVNKSLLSWLSKAIQQYKIPTQQMHFQVSEIDLHSNWSQAHSFCKSLDELGIRTLITRFGSAMEPVPVLAAIKPQAVRLDACLISDFHYSQQQQRNLRQLLRAVHQQEVDVYVSGIEEIELLPLLWDLGVDMIQGSSLQAPASELHYTFPRKERIKTSA